jgi:NADH:ubiquinone oxidoreductase subunit 3 (subunit A)
MNHWANALSFLVLSAVVGVSMLVIASVLRVRAKKDSPLKRQTYECGEEPEGLAWIQFHPRYYVVALVFVLFDVEAVFLFPWAVSLRGLGMLAVVDMLVFVGILLLGWVYALRKGALKWQ